MVSKNVRVRNIKKDLLYPILEEVCKISGKKYKENPKTDISLRIITDHLRCVSFMMADGIKGSNEGRGYVLRMILRRALRHGYLLGLELPFLAPLVDKVVEIYAGDVIVSTNDKGLVCKKKKISKNANVTVNGSKLKSNY